MEIENYHMKKPAEAGMGALGIPDDTKSGRGSLPCR